MGYIIVALQQLSFRRVEAFLHLLVLSFVEGDITEWNPQAKGGCSMQAVIRIPTRPDGPDLDRAVVTFRDKLQANFPNIRVMSMEIRYGYRGRRVLEIHAARTSTGGRRHL